MYKIKFDSSYAVVTPTLSDELLEVIKKECSFFKQGSQYTKAFQDGKWDGRVNLFTKEQSFPTGLLSLVVKHLPKAKIEDLRLKPLNQIATKWTFEHDLRYYQEEAVEKAITSQRGILHLATGAGKTIVALNIAHRLGLKTLFIVNTKEALIDTVNAAKKCFTEEIIGEYSGSKKIVGDFITIATMGTITYSKKGPYKSKMFINREKLIKENFNLIFVDECHHVGSDSWQKAILAFRNTFYRFGLTGTPFRSDAGDLLLQTVTGRLISSIEAKRLQKEGFLVPATVYLHKITKPDNLNIPLTYAEVYEFGIIKNEFRNKKIAEIAAEYKDKSTLIVVEKIEHGETLLELLKEVDKDTVFITGQSKNRAELKKKFENKEITTVIATRIYNESADVPVIEVVINAASGKSGVSVIQRIGRALRLHEAKKEAIIHDFIDSFSRKLEEHSLERMKWIKKEGHKIVIKENK